MGQFCRLGKERKKINDKEASCCRLILCILVVYSAVVTGLMISEKKENVLYEELKSRDALVTIDEDFIEICAWEAIGRTMMNDEIWKGRWML